jgi:26S proteasome non-ATPase regulatory subunit 10
MRLLDPLVDKNASLKEYQFVSLPVPYILSYPNAQDERGWTPIHFAATCGHLQITNLLSNRGANVHSRKEHRRTPLHLTAFSGDGDMARWLVVHGANIHSRDDPGRTPFSVALETGNRKVARLLSDWGSS